MSYKALFLSVIAFAVLAMPQPADAALKKVKNVRVTQIEETSVKVKWNKRKNAKRYRVQLRTADGEKLKTWKKVKKKNKMIKSSLDLLEAGTKYKVRVRACKKKKCGKWSKYKTFTTAAAQSEEGGQSYMCSSDIYNCSSFSTQAEAQAAYDFCLAEVGIDIHRLDGDNNGLACESL